MDDTKQVGMGLEKGSNERREAQVGKAADTRKEDQAAHVQQQPRREPAMNLKLPNIAAGRWT